MLEADLLCVVVETFNSHPCKLPQMLVPEVKLKAMTSRDVEVLPVDTIEILLETLKETGEISQLKVNNKISKARWAIFRISSKAISNLDTAIVVQ